MRRLIIERYVIRTVMAAVAFGLLISLHFVGTIAASAAIPPKPTVVSPKANTVDPTPAFTWHQSPGANAYDVQVFDIPGNRLYQRLPAAVVCSDSICRHISGKIFPNGSYKWRVRAINASGKSAWTPYQSFSVVGPARPAPQAPKGTVRVSKPAYSWTAVQGAREYVLKAYDSEGSRIFIRVYNSSSVCSGSTCSITGDNVLAVGSYSWQVRGQHQGGGGSWSGLTGFSVKGPDTPVSVSPKSGILDPTPAYAWNLSAGASSYDVQVFDSTGARIYQRSPAAIECSGTICRHISDKTLTNGSYSWRVRAANSVGASGWSGQTFNIVGPAQPKPLAPAGKITVSRPTYTWSPVEGATTYVIKVFDETGTRQLLTSCDASKVCSGSVCSATPAKDLIPGDHTWQIRGQHAGGAGSWSSELAFYAAPASWAGIGCSGPYTVGDFNGDGRTDRLCSKTLGVTYVSLSTASGLKEGTPWLPNYIKRPITGDFNGDGKADLVSFTESTGEFKVAHSTGVEFEPRISWGVAEAPLAGATYRCSGPSAMTGAGDFNGDGRIDVYCYEPSGRVMVGLNTGSSFSFSIFSESTCGGGGERVGAADFDGDGFTDLYCLQAGGALSPRLSNGAAFEEGSFTGLDSGYCEADRIMLADLNIDGALDAICPTNGNVALSTGQSFIHQGSFGGFCHYGNTFPADLDGDGVPEVVCNKFEDQDPETGEFIPRQRDVLVRKWNGTRLLQDEIWAKYFCTGDYTMGAGDFDGDGRSDLICGVDKVGVSGTSGRLSDLMINMKSELGGTKSVVYTPSSAFPNTNYPGVQHLVTAVTVADGRGGSSTTSHSYFGAKVDRQERRFLGFEQITTTLPCLENEEECPYTVTTFSQDIESAGRPVTIERFTGNGDLLHATINTYSKSSKNIPRTASLTETDFWTYGPNDSLHTYATYEYDIYGNLKRSVSWGDAAFVGDEIEHQMSYAYNTEDFIVGRVGQVVAREVGGPILTETQYEYDDSGNWPTPPTKGDLTAIKRRLASESRYVARRMSYYPEGNVRRVIDETGRWKETAYENETGYALFPVKHWNAMNEAANYSWDAVCQSIEMATDPNGRTTATQYDELCRTVRTDLPSGGWIERFYLDPGDPFSQRTRIEVPAHPGAHGPGWREVYFDGLGRNYRTEKRGPAEQGDIIAEISYNARGAIKTKTAPFYTGEIPRKISYEYDALNRLIKTNRSGNAVNHTRYDARSLTQTDPAGKTVMKRFDAYGRLIEVERFLDSQPILSRFIYDVLGRQTGMADAIGSEWIWVYDSLGRLTDKHDPDAGHWHYAYDDAGRLKTRVDAIGQVMTLNYDTVGRLEEKNNPDGTILYSYGELREGYANIGRLTSVISLSDAMEIDYDWLGRPVRQNRTLHGQSYELQRTYDDLTGLLSIITYPDGDRVGPITYDEAGRIFSIAGIVDALAYDAAGRPLKQVNANATETTWTYTTDQGFLETAFTVGEHGLVQDIAYAYDTEGVGLVKKVTSALKGEGWDYSYDEFYRMESAVNHSYPEESQDFIYDVVGRMEYNSRVGNYTYPDPGQPRPHAPKEIEGGSFVYNANGNLLNGNGRSFVWNADNLVSQVTVGTITTNFEYDGFGSRLKKISEASTSLYPFGDDYEITDGVVTKYISAAGLGVIAKRVGFGPDAEIYWFHNDRLGSIQAATAQDGRVALRRTYRPFGVTLGGDSDHAESRGWIDQRNDTETGLVYLHARYYDPKLGLFVSPDPLHPARPGVGMNRYAYAFNNPVNWTDRSGLLVKVCMPSSVDGGNSKDPVCWWTNEYVEVEAEVPGGVDPIPYVFIFIDDRVTREIIFPGEGVIGPTGGMFPNEPINPQPGDCSGDDCVSPPQDPPAVPPENSKKPNKRWLPDADDAIFDPAALWRHYLLQPCQSFSQRVSQNVSATNSTLGGTGIRTGIQFLGGLGASGMVGNAIGAPTVLAAATGGFEGVTYAGGVIFAGQAEALAASAGTWGLTGALVFSSLELGIIGGSALEAGAHSLGCTP